MAQYLYWQELTRPGRWPKSLRPAMAGLEARLPGMMGVNIWLHRNVSVSDLELIGNPSVSPTADELWPLMYLVCRFRKALLGVQLVNRKEQDTWKVETLIMEGVPCFSGQQHLLFYQEIDAHAIIIVGGGKNGYQKTARKREGCNGSKTFMGKFAA